MNVCKRAGCKFLRSNSINLYCCKLCKAGGSHGPLCQKLRPRNVPVILSVSAISWGDSVYGKYIVFNFKTNIKTPIVAINYKVYEASKVIVQGKVPYIFRDSQIIFTNVNIIDKKVSLELSLVLPGGTISGTKSSSVTNLNSSPYINCDYFEQDSGTTTTTTKATTKATTKNTSNGTYITEQTTMPGTLATTLTTTMATTMATTLATTMATTQAPNTILLTATDLNSTQVTLSWNINFVTVNFGWGIKLQIAKVTDASNLTSTYFDITNTINITSDAVANVDKGFKYAVRAKKLNDFVFSNIVQT